MKVKPKEVLLNLPVALLFDEPEEIASFAANINTILHGKVRLKIEELGTLGNKYIGLFYLQRNDEFQQIRDEFMKLIEEEEMQAKYADSRLLCKKCGLVFGRISDWENHTASCDG